MWLSQSWVKGGIKDITYASIKCKQVQNGKYFDDSVVFGTGCIVGSFMGSYLNAIWCILLMSEMKKHSLPRHSYHTHTHSFQDKI